MHPYLGLVSDSKGWPITEIFIWYKNEALIRMGYECIHVDVSSPEILLSSVWQELRHLFFSWPWILLWWKNIPLKWQITQWKKYTECALIEPKFCNWFVHSISAFGNGDHNPNALLQFTAGFCLYSSIAIWQWGREKIAQMYSMWHQLYLFNNRKWMW